MNAAHASLDSDSHTYDLIIVHRRIEDMVHAQMRLANASYGKNFGSFDLAKCNVRLCLCHMQGLVSQLQLSCLQSTCLASLVFMGSLNSRGNFS